MNNDFGAKNVDRNIYVQPAGDGDDTEGHAIVRGIQDEGDDTEGHNFKF